MNGIKDVEAVTAATVLREWNILSNALNVAVDEWEWLNKNVLKPVGKPKKPPPRVRIATQEEIARLQFCSGYKEDEPLDTAEKRTFAGFLICQEIALRTGELCALDWHEVHFDERYLFVSGLKPGARKSDAAVRNVPLNNKTIKILRHLEETTKATGSVLDVSNGNRDAVYRAICNKAMVVGLNFHDTRHNAITKLARIYEVLDLARIVGHSDLNELMVYYNPTTQELVNRMPDDE